MARRMGTVTQKPNGKWLARVAVNVINLGAGYIIWHPSSPPT